MLNAIITPPTSRVVICAKCGNLLGIINSLGLHIAQRYRGTIDLYKTRTREITCLCGAQNGIGVPDPKDTEERASNYAEGYRNGYFDRVMGIMSQIALTTPEYNMPGYAEGYQDGHLNGKE